MYFGKSTTVKVLKQPRLVHMCSEIPLHGISTYPSPIRNFLPINIREQTSILSFKIKLKTTFFTVYKYVFTDDDYDNLMDYVLLEHNYLQSVKGTPRSYFSKC